MHIYQERKKEINVKKKILEQTSGKNIMHITKYRVIFVAEFI